MDGYIDEIIEGLITEDQSVFSKIIVNGPGQNLSISLYAPYPIFF